MAKLEVVIGANTTAFNRALDEATAKAQEFAGKMAGVGNNLVASLSGIDIEKALKLGVAVYAAQKLGDALVSAAKRGYAAFEAYQEAVLRFKYTLPAGIGGGAAAGGHAEAIATMAGSKSGLYSADQMRMAALYLTEASKELRESPEKLSDMLDSLKALALKTGEGPEAIAESYRRLIVGIKEEGGMAVGKFFKSTPGLEAETEKLRDAHAEAYLHAQGLTDASQATTAQASEYHRLQNEPIAEFMTQESQRKGATAVLEEIKAIMEKSAPKGIIGEAEAEKPGAMLAKAWGGVNKAFGEELKPAIDDFIRMLTSAMPAIKTDLVSFGAALNVVIEGIIPILSAFGSALQFVLGPLAGMKEALDASTDNVLAKAKAESEHVDQIIERKKREKEITEAPEKAARAALGGETGIYSKERVKSEEEVAKIAAKTDADHEESQRRIRASIEGEGAIEEEAANRIAKINEEVTIRNVERQAALAKDDSDERTATLARLNAEDQAAQIARDDIMAEAREKERVADLKNAEEVAKIGIKSAAEHEASEKRINFQAAQSDLRSAALHASRLAVIDRPRGATEALDKQYAAEAESMAKIINIKAGAQEKINTAEEEAAIRIARIDEEAAIRNVERSNLAGKIDSEEKTATLARLNAEDDAAQISRNDAMAEAREKEREADKDAANQIIDAQEEAAVKIIDAQEAAALAMIDKMQGPAAIEKEPPEWGEFGKWGTPGKSSLGEYHESASERKEREERNRAAEEANNAWKIQQKLIIAREFEEKKRIIEDALEAQRPTQISLKHVHEIQQEEHVKAIEAERGRTEADQSFAKEHEKLKLPPPPGKEPTGKSDVSRQVLAEILSKIFDEISAQKEDFDKVFLTA